MFKVISFTIAEKFYLKSKNDRISGKSNFCIRSKFKILKRAMLIISIVLFECKFQHFRVFIVIFYYILVICDDKTK